MCTFRLFHFIDRVKPKLYFGLMGTSQQAISRIESGDYEGFSLKTLEKIAQATLTRLKIDFVPLRKVG